ncbi:MAG: hypothetical protein JW987_05560 [Anaerolineaceae bacterium]|nr:hypothetical protein [Anaerolineaceae bacterium]
MKQVGLWIDRSKAVIVTIEEDAEMMREIKSNIKTPTRSASGVRAQALKRSPGLTDAAATKDPNSHHPLGQYFEGIASLIREADTIWIFGPGEAKVGLENQLKGEGLGGRILGVETVEKMTDRQIAAKVRDRFLR